MSRRIALCRADEVQPGELRTFPVENTLLLLANVDGTFYATDAYCTHEHAELVDGYLEDRCVVCPLHFSLFSLETGAVVEGPATRPLRTYRVEVEAGSVVVILDEE